MEEQIINFGAIDGDWHLAHPGLREHFEEVDSQIMWALSLYAAPNSPHRNLLNNEKKLLIQQDFLKYDIDWSEYHQQIRDIINFTTSKKKKFLKYWESELDDRFEFLESIKYSLETSPAALELKEKWMGNTDKLWKAYEAAYKSAAEENESSALAGARESLSELNLI